VSVNWPGATEVALDIRTLFPDFVEDIFQTPSWDALMTQYVGSVDAVYAGSYDLDSLITLAPTNSLGSDFAGPEIAAQIASGALPPSAENLIYVVHVPPGIEIFDSDPGGVGVSCERGFLIPGSAISLLNSRALPTCYFAGVAETQL
jgi:hypothetical protein